MIHTCAAHKLTQLCAATQASVGGAHRRQFPDHGAPRGPRSCSIPSHLVMGRWTVQTSPAGGGRCGSPSLTPQGAPAPGLALRRQVILCCRPPLEPCQPSTESGPSSRDLPPVPSTRPGADTWLRSGLSVGWPRSAPTPPVYLSLRTPTGRLTPRPPISLLLGRHVPSPPCRPSPRLPRPS